jgi:hypothetical protein
MQSRRPVAAVADARAGRAGRDRAGGRLTFASLVIDQALVFGSGSGPTTLRIDP